MAYILFTIAVAQGNDDAQRYRDLSLEALSSEQVKEGQRLASEWHRGTSLPSPGDLTTWP